MSTTFPCAKCGTAIPSDGLRSGSMTKCPGCKGDSFVPLLNMPRETGKLRCPKCTARVEEGDATCKFCQIKLPGPVTRRRVAEELFGRRLSQWKRFVLVWVTLLAGLLTWWLWPGPEIMPPEQACSSNLGFLYSIYSQAAKPGRPLPSTLGSQFWQDLLFREMGGGAFPACPAAVRAGKGGVLGYRGPGLPIQKLPGTGIIACDFRDVHPGGLTILLKNGSILRALPGSQEYDRALSETRE